MALQYRMPFLPNHADMVSEHLAVARQDGPVTFFDASGPIFICDAHDEGSLRFAAVMLTNPVLGLATPSQMATVLGRHRSRVHEYRKRYQDGGAKALDVRRRGPRGPTKFKGSVSPERRPASTWARKVAKLVGVNEKTIRNAVTEGRLLRTKQAADDPHRVSDEAPSTPRERSDEDALCAGGVATTREAERALAPTGLLVEATPQFEPAESVAKAGVLVALPALLGQGLVEVGQQLYGSLKHGYYGLTSMLLRRPDGPGAYQEPRRTDHPCARGVEAVCWLGPRAGNEDGATQTAELAAAVGVGARRAFAERWATEAPDALGYLYIDGHVRPYHGRTLTLPKTHVPRRRLCMPATTEYWVNDANAEPLLFITAPANEGLLAMMTQELLPQIRTLGRRASGDVDLRPRGVEPEDLPRGRRPALT